MSIHCETEKFWQSVYTRATLLRATLYVNGMLGTWRHRARIPVKRRHSRALAASLVCMGESSHPAELSSFAAEAIALEEAATYAKRIIEKQTEPLGKRHRVL